MRAVMQFGGRILDVGCVEKKSLPTRGSVFPSVFVTTSTSGTAFRAPEEQNDDEEG